MYSEQLTGTDCHTQYKIVSARLGPPSLIIFNMSTEERNSRDEVSSRSSAERIGRCCEWGDPPKAWRALSEEYITAFPSNGGWRVTYDFRTMLWLQSVTVGKSRVSTSAVVSTVATGLLVYREKFATVTAREEAARVSRARPHIILWRRDYSIEIQNTALVANSFGSGRQSVSIRLLLQVIHGRFIGLR